MLSSTGNCGALLFSTRGDFCPGGDICQRLETCLVSHITHSSILAWKIPWTEEPGRLQFMRLQSQTGLRIEHAHHLYLLIEKGFFFPSFSLLEHHWSFRTISDLKVETNCTDSPSNVLIPSSTNFLAADGLQRKKNIISISSETQDPYNK